MPQLLAAPGRQHRDAPQPEGAVLPPDAARGRGFALPVDHHVPGHGVQGVGPAAQDLAADGKGLGQVRPGREPFSFDHMRLPFPTAEIQATKIQEANA